MTQNPIFDGVKMAIFGRSNFGKRFVTLNLSENDTVFEENT